MFTTLSTPIKEQSAPTETTSDVQMSSLEEQDDLQSLKEDIGEVVFDKEKTSESTPSAPAISEGEAPKAGPLNATSPAGQNVAADKSEKAEIIADGSMNFDVGGEEKNY